MLVRRDRNHPSVVMWSIGNEVGEQGRGEAGRGTRARPRRHRPRGRSDAADDHGDELRAGGEPVCRRGRPDRPQLPGHGRAQRAAAVSRLSRTCSQQVRLRQRDGIDDQQPRRIHVPGRAGLGVPASATAGEDVARASSAPTICTSRHGPTRPTGSSWRRTTIPSSAANSSGPAWTIWASRRRSTRRAARTSASSIWRASGRTASTCIRRAGVRTCRWRTSCRTGTGRNARARSRRCTSTRPATKAELFLNGKSLGRKKRGPANTACAGTMSSTSRGR